MIRRPPGSTLTDTLLPYTTLFRSAAAVEKAGDRRAVILILRGEIARADVFEQLQRAVRGGGAEIGVARVGEQRHALLHDEGVEIARVARIFVGGGLHEIGLAGAALELFGLREQFLGRTGEDGLAVPHQPGLAEQIGDRKST